MPAVPAPRSWLNSSRKKLPVAILSLPALLFLHSVLFAQGHNATVAQHPGVPNPTEDAAVGRGQANFKSSCGFCHGADATGSRAPDLLRSSVTVHDENGNLLAPVIRNGRPDKGMPAFANLKDTQVADIVAFLHHQAALALHSAHVPGDYPVAKLLTGNLAEGKTFFFGAGGCSGCHQVDGDLKGIAAKMSPVDLQQAMVYPGGKNAPKVKATVTAKDGTRYEGPVVHRDEFRIGIMCQDGWYRSFAVSDVDIAIQDPLQAHRALMNRYTDADIHNLFAFMETLK